MAALALGTAGGGRRDPGKVVAGALALAVHVLFLAFLVFGVSWQNREPAPVQAELWSSLPAAAPPPPRQAPPPEPRRETKPAPQPEPKPAPKPAKPEPVRETKADIELKAREARRKEEQRKEELRRQTEEEEKRRQQDKKLKQDEAKRKEQQERARLEQEMKAQQAKEAEETRQRQEAIAAAARAQASARERLKKDYAAKIKAKIKQYINNQPCQSLGDPLVLFSVTLMPTGELLMDPRLTKTSGSTACDEAVERAIRRAQPLPLPPDTTLFRDFRELNLELRPNEGADR